MNLHTRLGLAFADAHPTEAAGVLAKLPVEKAAPLLLSLQPRAMERLLEQLPADFAAECLLTLERSTACRLLVSLDLELQMRVLRRLDARQRDELLRDLKPELEMIQSADTAHEFWLGRLNITRAIATRRR